MASANAKKTVRLHPTAMSSHMSLTLRILGWLFFRYVRFDHERAETVRHAARRGTVIHVLRDRSLVDYLFFNWAYLQLGLPLALFTNALGGVILHPFRALFRLVTGRGREEGDGLTTSIGRGDSALLFLRKPTTLTQALEREWKRDYVLELVRMQRLRATPILLVPQLLLWTRAPERYQKSLVDIVFGDADAPGLLRGLWLFLRHHRRAFAQVAEPIDLQALLARYPQQTDEVLAKKVRWTLLHYLARERQSVLGPMMKSPRRLADEVMRDPALRTVLAELADAPVPAGKKRQRPESRARSLIKEIRADLSMRAIVLYSTILKWVFSRLYDGIEIDEEGMDRVRQALKRGPVVLVPCHRSHIDYLLLSHLFYRHGLVPPHIAAGKNLSFWPMGFIFRKGGAFFLRRAFRGDKLYGAVFRAYVMKLLREGHPIEFFIEGGRSRTGKMLFPKTGLLSIVADAVLDGRVRDVQIVPIHIGYQKIIEAGSYNKEVMGGQKQKENLKGLLAVPRVFRAKYGRVHLDFAEPISTSAFFASRGVDDGRALGEPARRGLVKALGFRITYDITRVARPATSAISAAVLLGEGRRGMTRERFQALTHLLRDLLRAKHVRLPRAISGAASEAAFAEAIALFQENGLVDIRNQQDDTIVYAVPEGARLALDYYKNGVLHALVAEAIVACALLSEPKLHEPGAPADAEVSHFPRVKVREKAKTLSRLLKFEFVFRPGVQFDALFDDAVENLLRAGILQSAEGVLGFERRREQDVRLLAGLVQHFVEAYAMAAAGLDEVLSEPLAEKELLARVFERAQKAFLTGELDRAEAASKLIFENALRYFRSEGVLAEVAEDDEHKSLVRLSGQHATPDALRELERRVRAYLPHPHAE